MSRLDKVAPVHGKIQQLTAFALRALRKSGVLSHLNFTTTRATGRTVQRIPLRGTIGIDHFFDHEPWMQTVLEKLKLRPTDLFLDIGVNIGQTLLSLRAAYPSQPYLGFEPNPSCVSYTLDLAKENSYTDVRVIPVGIGDSIQIASLRYAPDNPVDSAATALDRYSGKQEAVQHICLVGYPELKPLLDVAIGAMKIDVEGLEFEVLKSLEPVITERRPPILLEVLPNYGGREQRRLERQRALEALLTKFEYNIARIVRDESLEFVALEPLDSFGTHDNIEWKDYLLTPKDQLSKSTN